MTTVELQKYPMIYRGFFKPQIGEVNLTLHQSYRAGWLQEFWSWRSWTYRNSCRLISPDILNTNGIYVPIDTFGGWIYDFHESGESHGAYLGNFCSSQNMYQMLHCPWKNGAWKMIWWSCPIEKLVLQGRTLKLREGIFLKNGFN